MGQYRVTDPETGRVLVLTGDSPPTPEELEEIFASQQPNALDEVRKRVGQNAQLLGADPGTQAALMRGETEGLADEFTSQTTNGVQPELIQSLAADIKLIRGETPEQRAVRLGATPGVALTEAQKDSIRRGQQITTKPPLLTDASGMQQKPMDDAVNGEGVFGRNVHQGLMNVGGGIMRGFGELADAIGVDSARKFLSDLATSQSIEQTETNIISEGHPIKAFGGEVVGETLGFPAGSGGNTLLTRLLTSALAGGTNAGLSEAGRGGTGTDVALQTGLGVTLSPAAEGGAAYLRNVRRGRQAVAAGGTEATDDAIGNAAREIEEAQRVTGDMNTRLLPAQQTLDPFQLEQQAFLGQNPEVSRRAFEVLRTQNKEVAADVANLLNQIAEPGSVGTSASRARTAANNIINAQKLIRAEKASPLYKRAFAAAPEVNVGPVNDVIDGILEELPQSGTIRAKVMQARNLLRGTTRKGVGANGEDVVDPPTLQQLHGAKMQIDEMLSAVGEKRLGPSTKRYLMQIKENLVGQMEESSDLYRQGRVAYRDASPAVDDLLDGVLGRVAKVKDTSLKTVSSMIFDAAETNPEVMRQTVRLLKNVEGGDEILHGLLRTEIQKRMGRLRIGVIEASQTGGRTLDNIPGQFLRTLYGNDAQKKLLYSALDELSPEAARNARWLEKTLTRAKEGRPGGSQTGIRSVIDKKLRGGSLAVRDFFRKPVATLIGIGDEEVYNMKVRALGEALYNPDWAPDMARIRRMGTDSAEAASKFERLLNDIVMVNRSIGTSTQAITVAGRQALRDDE